VEKRYGNVPAISCYPNQLNQAFMSLLLFVVRATKDGGRITVATESLGSGARVKLTSDSYQESEAMPLERIFDPSFATRGKRIEAGMDLSIAYRIVEHHGGAVSVSRLADAGIDICLDIPDSPSSEPPKGRAHSTPPAQGAGAAES
jgi:signal transduction histidine kinase